MAFRRRLPVHSSEAPPIEERIAVGLHKLGLAMKQQNWREAAEDGLSPTQGQILAALATSGSLTATEVSQRLGVTLPTISDSVRALVAKGFVEKRPDARHPRASALVLTASGRTRAARAAAWPDFLATAVATLSEPERDAFLSGLVKMIRSLQEAGNIPTSRMCVTCTYFRPNVHEGQRAHHCDFVDAPMAGDEQRIDCPEHEEAPVEKRAQTWERFIAVR